VARQTNSPSRGPLIASSPRTKVRCKDPPCAPKRQAEGHIFEVLLRVRTGVRPKPWTCPRLPMPRGRQLGTARASCECAPSLQSSTKTAVSMVQEQKNGGRKPENCESATGSLAIGASDRGPSHPCGVTPTDRDCQRCPEGAQLSKPGTPPLDPRWTFPRATPMTRGCNPGGLNNDQCNSAAGDADNPAQ